MNTYKKKFINPSITVFLLIFILCNLAFLNYLMFKISLEPKNEVLGETTSTDDICPQSCIKQFSKYAGVSSAVKEYYIPLGTGTSAAADWTDVSGVQAIIDTNQYKKIKTVVFEVTVQVPTGNQAVWTRLYNVTDKHPVWFSEVIAGGTSSTLVISQPVSLDKGNKLYQVQMKTQLQYPANLTQSRIHIITY